MSVWKGEFRTAKDTTTESITETDVINSVAATDELSIDLPLRNFPATISVPGEAGRSQFRVYLTAQLKSVAIAHYAFSESPKNDNLRHIADMERIVAVTAARFYGRETFSKATAEFLELFELFRRFFLVADDPATTGFKKTVDEFAVAYQLSQTKTLNDLVARVKKQYDDKKSPNRYESTQKQAVNALVNIALNGDLAMKMSTPITDRNIIHIYRNILVAYAYLLAGDAASAYAGFDTAFKFAFLNWK